MFGFGNAARIAAIEESHAAVLAAKDTEIATLTRQLKLAEEDNERLRRNDRVVGTALNSALKERDAAREEANDLRPDATRYRDQKARRCANLTPGGKPHKKRANGATAH